MYSALRSVKVVPPRFQVMEVERPRLLAALDRAIERPVSLICSGPGSGKTVLVSQWTRANSHRVVWVSLDAEDDREARFWTLVQYALRDRGLLGDLSAPDTGRSLAEHAVDDLAEAASRGDDLLVLVLDDVHVLSDPDVLGTLDELLRRPPPQLRVIMAARQDPMLPLHRYRIQGNLSEIRASELAMTVPEVEQLLALQGLQLVPSEIEILAKRTEGWVAGLRLMAMRMEENPEPGRLVNDFGIDRGSIGEYLMEEVVSAQPRAVQQLLIQSSICEPISGPLADAICSSESGNSVLGDLANRNAFVMALDHQGLRFRYHPLLREVLRYLFSLEPATSQRRSHENAARWHAAEGDLVEALRHALAAQDWSFCTDLLIRGAFADLFLLAAARPIGGMGRFVDAASGPGVDDAEEARLLAAQAAVSVAIGRYDRASALLQALEHLHLDDAGTVLQAFAQLLVARQAGDLKGLEAAFGVLTQQDPDGSFGIFATYELGSGYLWQGSDHLAEGHLQQALKQATAQSLHSIALRCVGRLAIASCTAGRVARAEEFLEEGATLLQAHPWIPEDFRVAYQLGGAEVALLHGDVDLYSRFLSLVDDALAPRTDPALSYMAALIRAKALQSAGRYPEARELLLAHGGRELPDTWVLRTRADIILLELQGQMAKPRPTIERLESLVLVNESTAGRALLALARAHWAAHDVDAATAALRRVVTAHPPVPVYVLIEALLLSSEVADADGGETAAVEAATTAVQLAAGDRILLPFISAGPRLQGLLHRHPALTKLWPASLEDTPERWARELPTQQGDDRLTEALTEREVSILNWLTTTLSMAEIAAELYLSTNTVKTHVAAIYRKLKATNRREAIARGRHLHLI